MNKHFSLLSSLFIITAATVSADDQLIAQTQKQKQSRQKKQQQQNNATTQPKAMITPSVAPRVRDGAGLILTADFIWWKTTISQMEYATSGYADGGNFVPFGSNPSRGHVAQPDFDFQPGFKIGVGLDFAYDGWDLYANYTWLDGDAERNSIRAKDGNGVVTLFPLVEESGLVTVEALSKESSRWRQHFNVIDLELGRNFFISRRLTLRPNIGLKTAWIHEKWKLKFDEIPDDFEATQKRKQTLWGIGTRAGLNTVWHFSKNWGLYGDFAATALWSDFHVHATDKTSEGPSTTLKTKEVITKIIPVFETGIGVTYMTWFDSDEYMFDVSAGWEEQIWLDFNNFVDFNRSGNLSVHGLTVKLGFAF